MTNISLKQSKIVQSLLKIIMKQQHHTSIRLLHRTLQQKVQQSEHLRIKYPTEPMKFFPIQQQINEILFNIANELTNINQLFGQIVDSKLCFSILSILEHPNPDLICKGIQIFYEIIVEGQPQIADQQNGQNLQNVYAQYYRLCVFLFQHGVLRSLCKVLCSNVLSEQKTEQYQAVNKILKIFQTMLDLHADIAMQFLQGRTEQDREDSKENLRILGYLADRIMPNFVVDFKTIDDNKYVASDILTTLLQKSSKSIQIFTIMHGIQILLSCLKSYIGKDTDKKTKHGKQNSTYTQTLDEHQYISNLFDCLMYMLSNTNFAFGNQIQEAVQLQRKCVAQFHEISGSSIMLWFIKRKNEHSILALKVVQTALNNSFDLEQTQQDQQIPINPQILVTDLIKNENILKYIFAILMRQGIKSQQIDQQQEIDERTLSIILFLCSCLLANSSEDYQLHILQDRLLFKFHENRFSKLERIFQLYDEKIKEVKLKNNFIEEEQKTLTAQNYFTLSKQGLMICEYSLQIILILILLSNSGSKIGKHSEEVCQRIAQLMKIYEIRTEQAEVILRMKYKLGPQGFSKYLLEILLNQGIKQLQALLMSNIVSYDQKQQKMIENDQPQIIEQPQRQRSRDKKIRRPALPQ